MMVCRGGTLGTMHVDGLVRYMCVRVSNCVCAWFCVLYQDVYECA